MNQTILTVTQNIAQRSAATRQAYLSKIENQAAKGKDRARLSCGNLAHTVAACAETQKNTILDFTTVNVGMVSAFSDMLSAHQPYHYYPDIIKKALASAGHSAQVAGGVPAMCDGVTQGQDGMDLSMFSRDLIAQATAVNLSHNTFDATLLLGVCDKIAPGQIMGALSFGHLPAAFVPSGPMPTGISNDEKVAIRQQYAAGEIGIEALQAMENRAYHSAGTCTFYGTANTNQLVFEAMGLMLPGSAFVSPTSPLRHALTQEISLNMVKIAQSGGDYRPIGKVLDEKALVNGLVALLASGGSTNHTIHMIAIARMAGLILTWDDFDALSHVVPQLTKVYPNGKADINAFQDAGAVPTLMKRLHELELIHMDAMPVFGSMQDYLKTPYYEDGKLVWRDAEDSKDPQVIAAKGEVFSSQGGLQLLDGNLGRGMIKISAVAEKDRYVQAPARVFNSQHDVEKAYKNGELTQDVIIVVRHNGPAANGMPELHKLMPILGNLMKSGLKTALVTDGRLSGASGKVPAAIHMTPEATKGGPLAYVQTGDIITLDAQSGQINVDADLSTREPHYADLKQEHQGSGRELFGMFRQIISSAETGASIL